MAFNPVNPDRNKQAQEVIWEMQKTTKEKQTSISLSSIVSIISPLIIGAF